MKKAMQLLLALAGAGCTGPDGNPGNAPYANQPGGVMATAPHDLPPVKYDPNAPNPSSDAGLGAPALGSNGGAPTPMPNGPH